MIKDHAISPLFSNITPDTENDKTIIAEWLPHPMYGVWLHVPCVWSKSTSMSIHVMSVTTFFVCLGPELCQTIRVTSLITSDYKNTTPLHNASVTTTCKYEEQPVVIPGTIPIQRQSIIPRFEELSPSSVFSIPRLSFTSSLPMLCMAQSLELNSDPGRRTGLRLSLLFMRK